MDSEPAGTAPTIPYRRRTTRIDRAAVMPWGLSDRTAVWLSFAALAVGFVIVGGDALDLGPDEARLGLAAGGSVGPLGQAFGYWTLDLWPGEVLPSIALARMGSATRASAAVVRWPAALAAIVAGWLLVRGMYRACGHRDRDLGVRLLVRLHGRHGPLRRDRAGHDPGPGDAGGHRAAVVARRGLVRRTLGRAGLPRRRLAPAGADRAHHHRHRPAGLVFFPWTGDPAPGDRGRLVDCRQQDGVPRGVGDGDGHAADPRHRRMAAAGRRADGAALDAVRRPRPDATDAGRLDGPGPGLGQGLAPGRAGLRDRRHRGAGPGIGRAGRDPGRATRRGGGRPRFGVETRVRRRRRAGSSSPRSRSS